MKAIAICLVLALLAGCSPSPRDQAPREQAALDQGSGSVSEQSSAVLPIVEVEPNQLSAAKPPSPKPKVPAPKAVDGYVEEFEPFNERERCLPDYCPCQETGPVDIMLCRNMRAGVEVGNELLVAGAAQRDMRQEMRRYNRANPGNEIPM